MSKLEFLKRMFAMGLAITSFVPAVGAVESDDEMEGEPPAKIVGISEEDYSFEEDYNFNKMQAKGFVCMSYFQELAKDFIKGYPRGDAFMDAMKYMFEVFDEEIQPNNLIIERSLNIIDEYMHTWGEEKLMAEIYDRFVLFGVEFISKEPEISFPKKICGLTRSSFVAQFGIDRPNLEGGILRIKNFEKVISDKDEEFELRCVLTDAGDDYLLAVKNKNGKWISCLNNGIKEISEEDVIREASYIRKGGVLGYIKK